MASREIVLTSLKTGINRLRIKGGASPDSLYDLVNGYIDQSGTPRNRSGTSFVYTLPAGTKGLCQFGGKMIVFALADVTITNALFDYKIVRHPDPAFTGTIAQVHYSKPFLGWLYAAIEFSDGQILHYWLQEPKAWAAGYDYGVNDSVSPSVGNGFYYTASRANPPPAWQPNTSYGMGDVVQPQTYNGYVYTVVAVSGTNAKSGATEPTWPTADGGQVNEDANAVTTVVPTSPPAPAPSPTPTKYTNFTGNPKINNPKLLP